MPRLGRSGSGRAIRPWRVRADASGHTYLRLVPELRARVDGPKAGDEPAITGERHPVLRGFEETDLLAFGGTLDAVERGAGCHGPAHLRPALSHVSAGDGLDAGTEDDHPGTGPVAARPRRVAYMPADVDRRYAREHLPDHARCWRTSSAGPRTRPFP